MKILNLGCGTKVSSSPEVINIDWSIYLRIRKNLLFKAAVPFIVRGERLRRFNALSDNILVRDISKGIPFDSNSVDVVYHSHFLEHLDRNAAKIFLLEVRRVLKPGGVQRIVVPDLEKTCNDYLLHIKTCEKDTVEAGKHDFFVAAMIEQSVRREADGTSRQKPFRRFIENAVLGDARRRGETHEWMYDRINLSSLLGDLGYRDSVVQSYDTSLIPEWNQYRLDLNEHGNEYKPGSLYIEARS